MHDALRTLHQFPACGNAIRSIHLVETSLALQGQQERKLRTLGPQVHTRVFWHSDVKEVLEDDCPKEGLFTMVFAHEFFDALPVHVLEVCPSQFPALRRYCKSDIEN